MSQTSEALVPQIIVVNLPTANTEVDQALPPGTKKFDMQPRTAVDVRFATAANRAGPMTEPYATMKEGRPYNSPEKTSYSGSLWFASGTASVVVELVVWTAPIP